MPGLPTASWWEVRRAQNLKASTYTCPLCGERLPSMSEHALIVPDGDRSRRRHAHIACVARARERGELPSRDEHRRAARAGRATDSSGGSWWRRLLRARGTR